MVAEVPTFAAELFNSALEAFTRGDIEQAATCLRAGFFRNLYIAPLLVGEATYPQEIWYPSPDSEPEAAADYATRFGHLWRRADDSILFLREIWNDPLVRRELQSWINLCKAVHQAPDAERREEYLGETGWFLDQRRIRRTQQEIIARLQGNAFHRPLERPRFAAICLAARDPEATVEFYRRLLLVEPVTSSRRALGYAEFELPGVRLIVHGHDRVAAGDPFELGQPPASLGWGAVFVLKVREFDRYHENASRCGVRILESDLRTQGERFFVIKDPSGYLLEISE